MGLRSFWSGRSDRNLPRTRRAARSCTQPVETLEKRALLSATLTPVADADVQSLVIDASLATANFGGDSKLRVRLAPDETFETFLTFNISEVSAVGAATLKLHGGQGGTVAEPVVIGAFAAASGFVEGAGNHAGPPTIVGDPLGPVHFTNRPAGSGGALDTANVSATGDYDWDLTNLVKDAKAAGQAFVTVGLRHVGGSAAQVAFNSREGVEVPLPQLVIADPGPTAAVTAPDITTAGGVTQQVGVTFTDTDAIDTASIDAGDIEVRAADGSLLEVTGLSIDPTNPSAVVATYTVAAPGGTWDVADAGAYSASILAGAVKDVAGNAGPAASSSFNVSITATPPVDPEKPVGQIVQKPEEPVTDGTGTTIGVRFTDNVGVDASALTTASLVVVRVGGGSTSAPLDVTDVAVEPAADGKSVSVLFNVFAPLGLWKAEDNGLYEIRVAPGSVSDAAGNLSDALTASFTVALVSEPPPTTDTTAPTAQVVALDPIAAAGAATHDIRVAYADDVAVLLASIDVNDIIVTAPDGTVLDVTGVSVGSATDGPSITATYTVATPGDAWDSADNGIYTITLAGGAASDTSGNASAAANGNFTVAVPSPKPPVDPTFGVNTGFVGEAAVGQSDGKILVAGRQGDLASGASQLVLQRLNADGSLDATFGTGGKVIGAAGLNEAAFAIAVQPDGSIVIAGRRGSDLMVARFKPNGAVDNRFGAAGVALADFGGEDVAYSLVIAADGSILAAGGSKQASGDAFAFARFLVDGRVDTSFGDGGRSLFAQGAGGNVAGSVTLDSAGRIVAAGPTVDGGVAVVRLNANGTQDASFGASGILVVTGLATRADLGRPDRSIGIVALADGSVLVTNHTAGGDFAIAKIGAGGALDANFGDDGVAAIDFGGDDDADAILLQGSGEILVVGTTTAGGNKLAVAALGADGSLLTGFGTGGKLTIDATPVDTSRELHIGDLVLRAFGSVTGDGRLVIGASDQRPAAVSSTPLRRLNVPGSGLLGTFGQVGGKKGRKLTFQDADGTVVTISMKGAGAGQAYYDGSSLDLILTGVNNSSLVLTTKGGDGRVSLRNVQADGGLKAVSGKTTSVAGTFAVTSGNVGKVSLGNLTGTLAVAGSIASLVFAGDVKGTVLSGASYGVNGKPGGSGTATDSYAQGRIGKISVAGSLVGATFAAGLDPVNAKLLDGNDQLVGGSASSIGAVAVKGGADASTRFVAGAFAKKVKLPQPVDPLTDARFLRL